MRATPVRADRSRQRVRAPAAGANSHRLLYRGSNIRSRLQLQSLLLQLLALLLNGGQPHARLIELVRRGLQHQHLDCVQADVADEAGPDERVRHVRSFP